MCLVLDSQKFRGLARARGGFAVLGDDDGGGAPLSPCAKALALVAGDLRAFRPRDPGPLPEGVLLGEVAGAELVPVITPGHAQTME